MTLIEKERYSLASNFERGGPDQMVTIRKVDPATLRGIVIARIEVSAQRHTVVIQRSPIDILAEDYLRASGFTSSDRLDNTYEQRLYTTPRFERTFNPIATIPVGGSYEYTDAGILYTDSVVDLGERRFFTVTDMRRGANAIGIPRDLSPFVGEPPRQDFVHFIDIFAYNSSNWSH